MARMHAPNSVKQRVSYRSTKNVWENSFTTDMLYVLFHVCDVFNDDDAI